MKEKQTLVEKSYKDKLADVANQFKIDKSKAQIERKMQRMRDIMQLVDEMKTDMRMTLTNKLNDDQEMHKNLLKDLMVQGFIKLIEAKVTIKCREQDVDLIEQVKDQAISEYQNKMVSEVRQFADKSPEDIPCAVTIDKDFLDESCIGGFYMIAKKGRITLKQTLDDRVHLIQE